MPIRIGLIGFGYIGKVHAQAYASIPYCFPKPAAQAKIVAVLRSNPYQDEALVRQLGIDLVTANKEQFFSQVLDAVDICSPNVFHHQQAHEAFKRGLAVYCEKPIAMNLTEASQMAEAARQSGKTNHTAFTFRYRPCIRQARAMLSAGMVGEVRHFSARFYHSSYNDPTRPISWRLKQSQSGGGALADLGIHVIDTLRLLLGDFSSVQCETRTFINQRPVSTSSDQMELVDVDDWALCTLTLPNGAAGSLEVSRIALGNPNLMQIELIGNLGTIRIDFARDESADFFNNRTGLWESGSRNLPEAEKETPLKELYPPSKHSLGAHFNAHLASVYDFIRRTQNNQSSTADFDTAARAQETLEAAYLSSARGGSRVDLPLIT